ncbi:MAG TPA: hypothetical protein VJ828_06895 [Lacipirellulaceae bacterium]|nr:hypothetical protein [Lacipirellulaceae bacterium]
MATRIRTLSAAAALALFISSNTRAVVVIDDFSDLNDTANPAWTHLDAFVMSTGQTWDASTGVYRMSAPSNGFENIGAVGSHVGPEFTDVRVSMDLVEFYTTFAPPNGPEFVNIMARSNGNNTFGGLTGYAYGFDPIANANEGEMVLYRIDPNVDVNDIGAQRVTLDQTKQYRFMLEVIGNVIHGRVTEIGTGTVVAESFADISRGENLYSSGTSGVFGYTESPFRTLFAIDNFRAEEALAGDYNRDGSVDAADYVVWRATLGEQSPQLEPGPSFKVISFGKMSANGAVSGNCNHTTSNCEVIDEADYEIWRGNFGETVSDSGTGSAAAVPEPSSIVMSLASVVTLACLRRRGE